MILNQKLNCKLIFLILKVIVKFTVNLNYFSFKDGQEILEDQDSDERVQIIREKDYLGFYELVITEVRKEDAGRYTCQATNKLGTAECEANATVVGEFIFLLIFFFFFLFIKFLVCF